MPRPASRGQPASRFRSPRTRRSSVRRNRRDGDRVRREMSAAGDASAWRSDGIPPDAGCRKRERRRGVRLIFAVPAFGLRSRLQRTVRTCDGPFFSASLRGGATRPHTPERLATADHTASRFAFCLQSIHPVCQNDRSIRAGLLDRSGRTVCNGSQSFQLLPAGMLGTTPIPGIPRLSTPIPPFTLVFLQNDCDRGR